MSIDIYGYIFGLIMIVIVGGISYFGVELISHILKIVFSPLTKIRLFKYAKAKLTEHIRKGLVRISIHSFTFQKWAEEDQRIIYRRGGYWDYKGEYEAYTTVGLLLRSILGAFLITSLAFLLLKGRNMIDYNTTMWKYFGLVMLLMTIAFALKKKYKQEDNKSNDDIGFHPSDKRIALIMGNDQYEHFDPLKEQPLNDAQEVETRLKDLGFEVVKKLNLSREAIRKTIIEFKKQAKGYDVVLFFFAGHGMSHANENYLIPTDAEAPETENELDEVLYPLDNIVKLFKDLDAKWNIFWIDACRISPQFDTRGKATGKIGTTEATELEKWKKTRGKNVCYFFGTASGEYAYNGKNSNGIFTTALLKHLHTGIDLNDLHNLVTAETEKASGYKQLPYVQAKMTEGFRF